MQIILIGLEQQTGIREYFSNMGRIDRLARAPLKGATLHDYLRGVLPLCGFEQARIDDAQLQAFVSVNVQ